MVQRVLRMREERRPEREEEALNDLAFELHGELGRRALRELDTMLQAEVGAVWQRGWQPADVLRWGRRQLTGVEADILADSVLVHLSQFAPASITPTWRQQLDAFELRIWWPAHLGPLPARAAALPMGDVDVCLAGVPVVLFLQGLGPLPVLDPLPGRWRPPTKESPVVDDRVLERVRLLLAKAEATVYPAEAETFTAGAQALMARHSIDQAMLAASRPRTAADEPQARRVGVDRPYEAQKVLLLDVVAQANRCRTVWSKGAGFVTVVGFDGDLGATDTLYTSLLLQSTREMSAHGSQVTRYGQSRTRTFRQSFLGAFASRIGERLADATRTATQEAVDERQEQAGGHMPTPSPSGSRTAGPGRGLVQVLAARAQEVDEALDALFPGLVTTTIGRNVDLEGWQAGVAAADTANLFTLAELGEGSAASE